jgi:hypothetical protein
MPIDTKPPVVSSSRVVLLNLEQAQRALVVAFAARRPVALWGDPRIGKSSVFAQVFKRLGYKMYDVRLTDKEPSDLMIPYPVASKEGATPDAVKFLPTDLLPFGGEEKCGVLLDEFDRANISMQNMSLQLLFDRSLAGHELSPNALIALAGNGVTDTGTMALTKSAAGRICHLYVSTHVEGALDAWLNWASSADSAVTDITREFASFRPKVWAGETLLDKAAEMAYPAPDTLCAADAMMRACEDVDFDTDDVRLALVAGCIGRGAAAEFITFWEEHRVMPCLADILSDPMGTPVPDRIDILISVAETLPHRTARYIRDTHGDSQYSRTEWKNLLVWCARWPAEARRVISGELDGKWSGLPKNQLRAWEALQHSTSDTGFGSPRAPVVEVEQGAA